MSTSSIANFAISKKKFSVWESGKLFAYQFFRFCMHTHKGVNIDLIAGFYFWTPLKKKKKPTTITRKTAKNKNKQILITPVKKHIWNSLLDTFKTHFTIESHEKKLN